MYESEEGRHKQGREDYHLYVYHVYTTQLVF